MEDFRGWFRFRESDTLLGRGFGSLDTRAVSQVPRREGVGQGAAPLCSYVYPHGDVSHIERSVDYEGFIPPNSWGIRDQICTTEGLEVNCERVS